MSVTAGILNYNYARFVRQAIDAVAEADKIVVIDDGSTDESITVIRQAMHDHPQLELGVHKENSGSAVAGFNDIIKTCDTEWLSCLSADDAMLSGFKPFLAESDADWVWGDLVIIDEHGRDIDYWDYSRFPRSPEECIERIRKTHTNYPPFAGAFFRTSWIRENGLKALEWEDGFKGFEDTLWSWNWLKANPKLEYLHIPWCRYRRHSKQGTFTDDREGAMRRIGELVA